MRKLIAPCLLVISLMTASAAQLSVDTLNDTINKEDLKNPTIAYVEVTEEEKDELFDFNTAAYLPVGFNAHTSLEYEVVLEEADVPFDFNTKDYLPIGFGLKKSVLDTVVEITIEEEDEAFDFDIEAYLPKDFNATKKATINTEI